VKGFLMRIFVTGASGHIGSAVVPELLSAGHQVVGLARSDAAASSVEKLGAQVRRGDLDDLDGLREASIAADGVIHLAFRHDLMQAGDGAGAGQADLAALEVIAEALAGSGKPLVGTSGTLMAAMVAPGQVGTEEIVGQSGPRIDAENLVIGLAERGVRSSVIRLTPTVHSDLDRHGFVPAMIAIARQRGYAAYVGEGANRWPAVHTRDAARLYRLAVESAPGGNRLHAVDDEGVPFTEIAAAIGRGLDVPVRSISPEEAGDYFGFLAMLVQLDNPSTSTITRSLLDWQPQQPGLIADLDQGHYFRD
jgi:nucleoside-diphosphate-sugar epimerase